MEQEKKFDVFISYSRKDFNEVNAFIAMLKNRIPKLTIWFDLDGIESGDEFRDKIISAIKRSKYVLFALSNNSDKSKWTRKELDFARLHEIKIIPVLLKNVILKEMDWFSFEFGGVDCINSMEEKEVEKLLNNLANYTNKELIALNKEENKNKKLQNNDSILTIENIQDLILLGAKLSTDGVSHPLQERFINDLIKTKRVSTAQNNLGFYLSDPIKKIEWLEKAVENGSSVAMINLAQVYKNGEGINRDLDKAIYWYGQAITHGHDEFLDEVKELVKERNAQLKKS